MDDLDQDQENIPPMGNRPDYLNRLKARQQGKQNIAPIAVNTETDDDAEGQQSYSDSAAEALTNLFQQLFPSKLNQQMPRRELLSRVHRGANVAVAECSRPDRCSRPGRSTGVPQFAEGFST
jgi:hypothetical protein